MTDRGGNFVGTTWMLEGVAEVMSAKMELSCDEWKFAEDDLGAVSVSYSRISSAGSDLDSLTDRRGSVGIEDGGGIGDDDIGT